MIVEHCSVGEVIPKELLSFVVVLSVRTEVLKPCEDPSVSLLRLVSFDVQGRVMTR